MISDNIYSLIKKIAVNAVNSTKPCNWYYGYVKDLEPLNISLSDKLEIDEDFIEFGSYNKNNLEVGDKLILLQKSGGQLFLCLDVIRKGGKV